MQGTHESSKRMPGMHVEDVQLSKEIPVRGIDLSADLVKELLIYGTSLLNEL